MAQAQRTAWPVVPLPTRDSSRPVISLLRRQPRLRAGLIQAVYLAVAVGLAITIPWIKRGPTMDPDDIAPLAYGMAGGLLSFIALVFSLLFLVVQFGSTTFSPRLTLFRDDPLVWHSFAYFAAVFVFSTALGMNASALHHELTIVAPILLVLFVLVALALSRALQLRALKMLQFGANMETIRAHGEFVMSRFYRSPLLSAPVDSERSWDDTGDARELRWTAASTTLEQVDVPALVAEAGRLDGLIELEVRIGDELRRGMLVGRIRSTHPVDEHRVFDSFSTGVDRSFAQDPLLAFRLLSDIGDRSLSTAINDPATAVQALGCIQDLLTVVVDKQLDFNPISDESGVPRVLLRFPTWEEFVIAGLDEVAFYSAKSPLVRRRLEVLVADLERIAPPERVAVLGAWRDRALAQSR